MTEWWQRERFLLPARPIVYIISNLHRRRLEFDRESLGLLTLLSMLRAGVYCIDWLLLVVSFCSLPHRTEKNLLKYSTKDYDKDACYPLC